MSDLPRRFEITGPTWRLGENYIIDFDDVDDEGHVSVTYAPDYPNPIQPLDYNFRSYTEEDVLEQIARGFWVVVQAFVAPTNIEDLI